MDNSAPRELQCLAKQVLAWWDVHRFDVTQYLADDMEDAPMEEANAYDTPPDMVKTAMFILGR